MPSTVRTLLAQTILGLAVLSSCAVHAAPRPVPPAPVAGPAPALVVSSVPVAARPSSGRLEHALDVVRAENIRSDEFFIASDELGGRDTPSLGQRVAARYIRARLERLGWQPGAQDGFFFRYPLEQRKLDEEASKIEWKRGDEQGELRFGSDYFFTSSFDIKELSATGGVVFCGDGGTADFGKSGVSGKWALCLDDGTELRKLRAPAHQAGAIGVILAPGPGYTGESYEKRFAKDLAGQRRGSVFPRRRGAGEEAGKEEKKDDRKSDVIPTLMVGSGALSRLLRAAGVPAGGPAVGTDLGLELSESRKVAGPIDVEDVCAYWPGSDPELARETIIISAHYDHVGTQHGIVFNGADDNGSGTCGMMAIAEALASYGPMRRSVMLIWVSGEEKGLWGSAAWTKDPWIPQDGRPICDINIDMIGRNAPDKLLITPTKALPQYNGLVRIAEKVSPLEGFPKLGSCDEYWTRSDQKNFSDNLKIPVMFLFSDIHEDYHQPSDKPEKIDNDKIRRVVRMVLRMLEELQADRLEL
jgi:hypothetical protein